MQACAEHVPMFERVYRHAMGVCHATTDQLSLRQIVTYWLIVGCYRDILVVVACYCDILVIVAFYRDMLS